MSRRSLKAWLCVLFSIGDSERRAAQHRYQTRRGYPFRAVGVFTVGWQRLPTVSFSGGIMAIFTPPLDHNTIAGEKITQGNPSPNATFPSHLEYMCLCITLSLGVSSSAVHKATRDEGESPLPLLNGQHGGVPLRPSTTAGALVRSSTNAGFLKMEGSGEGRIFTPPR